VSDSKPYTPRIADFGPLAIEEADLVDPAVVAGAEGSEVAKRVGPVHVSLHFVAAVVERSFTDTEQGLMLRAGVNALA
jgi:hypothetical protein